MKSFIFLGLMAISLPSWANTLECLNRLQRLTGSDEILILQEEKSSDGFPLVLEISDLTIHSSTLTASVSSVGRKEGSDSGIVVKRTTGNFDIKDCRVSNNRMKFKMGSVTISELSAGILKASVLTWSSKFKVIN